MKRALIVLITALCGCAGGGSSGPPAGCGVVVATQSDPMVQPPNGATGVPVTVGSIAVPFTSALTGGAVVLQPASGPFVTAGRLAQAGTGGTTLTVTVPVLSANTRYDVTAYTSVPPDSTSQCWATTSWNLGSFTTQ